MRPTLGVAIPCYVDHYKYIEGLLANIAASTDKPDRICISCSSWTDNSKVLFVQDGIPIEILYTKQALNAAQNRNRAARALQTDLISFLDADDLMHPRRIEFLRTTFERDREIAALYHTYRHEHHSKRSDPFWEETAPTLLPNPIVKDPRAVGIMVVTDPPNQLSLHHAHVTVRSSVFPRIQFPENAEYARMEDSLYGALLVAHNVPMACLTNALSLYTFGP